MALETMTKIATFTASASPTNVLQFNNIPQHYTDLKLVISARSGGTSSYQGVYIQFAAPNATNNYGDLIYSGVTMRGSGAATDAYAFSGANAVLELPITNTLNTSNIFSNMEVYIPNYSGNHKKVIYVDCIKESNSGSTETWAMMRSTLWDNPAPISNMQIGTNILAPNFDGNSTFTLYGIQSMRKAMPLTGWASGGAITTDGTYIYHTFTQSNMFVANNSLKNVEVLAVAGGGGGGGYSGRGGGGGAGGLMYFNVGDLASGSYPAVVGAGGLGGVSASTNSSSGTGSWFGSLTEAIGGGRGGGNGSSDYAAAVGGSGGGGRAPGGSGAAGTSGQGNSGGNADGGGYGAGGGGGAGAAGGNGSGNNAGTGGNGSSAYSAWGSATSTGQNSSGTYYFAGGGSGGYTGSSAAAGLGGGGIGGSAVGTSGTANTGGGGGGANNGGNGGSGVVIIRYKA